ncbi:2-iminoacetate synthase ThiH [bacterium]|nr:MAG: 2-iminoacetate synthase ThiH [bacterium]
MSYYDFYLKYRDIICGDYFKSFSPGDVPDESFGALLSPAAEGLLEEMAQRAHAFTLQNFGKTIQIYTPLYLSDFCENECVYCGFNARNNTPRKKLTEEEVEKEAIAISSTGIKHLLVLTGDFRKKSPPEYIISCIKILKKYFTSVSIEIYALNEIEYRDIIAAGADGLTIYQETYDEALYADLHKKGPKRDYLFRLDAPQRAAKQGIRSINIGVLLGLSDWRKEIFFMGCHAKYLQDKFPGIEIGMSIPRLRPHMGEFKIPYKVSDTNMAQIITALRIYLPRAGITLSTRESAKLRENLLPLGITRMSAGSSTKVGNRGNSQFDISDTRSVKEVQEMLALKGYQPVFKDWMPI